MSVRINAAVNQTLVEIWVVGSARLCSFCDPRARGCRLGPRGRCCTLLATLLSPTGSCRFHRVESRLSGFGILHLISNGSEMQLRYSHSSQVLKIWAAELGETLQLSQVLRRAMLQEVRGRGARRVNAASQFVAKASSKWSAAFRSMTGRSDLFCPAIKLSQSFPCQPDL